MENETVWGYKRVICPKCNEGSKNSRRRGTYRLYQTNTHYILRCVKCEAKTTIEKIKKGRQLPVSIK